MKHLACVLVFAATAAVAQTDAALDARLKKLEEELRCLVCQNQSLADSSAGLAEDLRREVRALAVSGKSDAEIKDFLVARYGDFVLYDPPVKRSTWLLWFGPFVLLAGGVGAWWAIARRRKGVDDAPREPEGTLYSRGRRREGARTLDNPPDYRRGNVSIYGLKPRFQALLRPLTTSLARAGVTANQVTLAACVVSLALGAFVAWRAPDRWPFLLIPLWMFLRMAFNAIDGMLAREFGQKSRLGAYLNELTDVVSDTALYAPFALMAPFSPLWTALVIVLAVISEYAGVLGTMVGASRRYDGPMGKSDRAFVFGALGLWVGATASVPAWVGYAMPLLALALVVTIVNRVRNGLAENATP